MTDQQTEPPLSWALISRNLNAVVSERDKEWAGVPMPIPGLRLTVDPSHPWFDSVMSIQAIVHENPEHAPPLESAEDTDAEDADGSWTVRNEWFSRRLGYPVAICTNGRRVALSLGKHDYVRRFEFAIDTLQAATAWTIETELTAQEKLRDLLAHRPHLYHAYLVTGSFIETSSRSGVTYLFRRCRPTVAFRNQRILCTLCLHPLAYYEGTFAGSMCPTDDVIAHLLLMRGDEHLFWRRANQHAPWMPESGL